MPVITISASDLVLLRRCFARVSPESGCWDDRDDGERAPIPVESAASASSVLAAARPGEPVSFSQDAWEAFTACCEVGAELLDVGCAEDLTDAEYERVLWLLRSPEVIG